MEWKKGCRAVVELFLPLTVLVFLFRSRCVLCNQVIMALHGLLAYPALDSPIRLSPSLPLDEAGRNLHCILLFCMFWTGGRRMNKQIRRKSSSKSFRFHRSIFHHNTASLSIFFSALMLLIDFYCSGKPLPVAVFPS